MQFEHQISTPGEQQGRGALVSIDNHIELEANITVGAKKDVTWTPGFGSAYCGRRNSFFPPRISNDFQEVKGHRVHLL